MNSLQTAPTEPDPVRTAVCDGTRDTAHPFILPIPAFNDNFIWLLTLPGYDPAIVVDPGDADPVVNRLERLGRPLGAILVTHHHADHTGGIAALKARWPAARVFGPHDPRCRGIDQRMGEGDQWSASAALPMSFCVMAVPGHTLDHIAFLCEPIGSDPRRVLFPGDTLFAGGCGRLFEGTPEQLKHALARFAALPADTMVYCAHEYTQANLTFAAAAFPDHRGVARRLDGVRTLRGMGIDTLPSSIGIECATNPFVWTARDGTSAELGALRARKDVFR